MQTPEIPAFTRLKYLPRDAYYCGGELLPVFDERERVNRGLAKRVCADQIVPYPPGIPVLVPGQLITPDIAEYLANLLRSQKRMEMHGVVYEGYQPCVRALKTDEEKALRRDVRLEKERGFEDTATWHRVRASYAEHTGKKPAYARLPDVALSSPKITK